MTFFDIVAICAFFGQIANYTLFGRMRRLNIPMSNGHAALATAVLVCFSITEGIIAIEDGRISMWLYVSLNVYGIIQLWSNVLREKKIHENIHSSRSC